MTFSGCFFVVLKAAAVPLALICFVAWIADRWDKEDEEKEEKKPSPEVSSGSLSQLTLTAPSRREPIMRGGKNRC